ncbi:MAG: putative serine/threonine protein kinase [Gemmatimonadetes bacterium]|nr:putative serine/threonine protein kinase [Gemmatimonadota bacterium]
MLPGDTPDFFAHLQDALGTGYTLERELGGGGMSRVYVAVDKGLNREVVVKVLPPDLAAGVNRDRFRREIQVAAKLQHPHIVPLLTAGEQGDLLWYTMPLIEGESLRGALANGREFTVREAMRVMHDVVDALAYAHARGVIHRDIKPANILMHGSHALVADFGVAKAISAAMPVTTATAAGIAIGTPAYMAPEQLAGDADADHRMDIYAVGLLTYELLSGKSPFTGPSPRETMAAQLTRDPPIVSTIVPGVPETFSSLIMQCLAKDPEKRPASADEILRTLDEMTMPLTPHGTLARSAPTTRSTKRFVVAAVVAAVLVGGAVYAMRARSTEPAATAPAVAQAPPAPPLVVNTDSIAKAALAARVAAAPVLTAADSARIAEALTFRHEQARRRDSIAKVTKEALLERTRMDSLIAANSGRASSAGPRRIAIVEPRDQSQWPEATLLGRAVVDSLRRMLRARPRLYALVPTDSVRAAMAIPKSADSLSAAVKAELIASVQLIALPRDSALLQVALYDMGADRRRGRTRSVGGQRVARNEVLGTLDAMLLQTLAYLDDLTRSPRKPAAPVTPGAPPGD